MKRKKCEMDKSDHIIKVELPKITCPVCHLNIHGQQLVTDIKKEISEVRQ
jgi:hypothetical protein